MRTTRPAPIVTLQELRRVAILLVIAAALAAAALLTACATVGPTTKQGREGQELANSARNEVTLQDDQGTTTASVVGPTDWIRQDSGSTVSHTTGQVTRTIAVERPDGTRFTLRSGSDVQASGVEINPETGAVKIASFGTSSSAPLDALSRLVAEYAPIFKQLSADQRAAIESQTRDFLEAVKVISPDAFRFFSMLLSGAGVP